MDLWEWEFRVLDSEAGCKGDEAPVCLAGRGASPPEFCGGPTDYRLMLKRQQEGESMGTPAQVEAVIACSRLTAPPTEYINVFFPGENEIRPQLGNRIIGLNPG